VSELVKALVAAQAMVRSVALDGENTSQRYRYATTEAILDEGRRVLTAHGLALWLVGTDYQDTAITTPGTRERPESQTIAGWVMTCAYRLEHAGGETRDIRVVVPVIPGGGRPLDKAMMGARTSSLGYVIRDLLLMSRGEENDPNQRDDRDYEPGAPAPQPDRDPLKEIAGCKDIRQLAKLANAFAGKAGAPPATVVAHFDERARAIYADAKTPQELIALVDKVEATVEPWRAALMGRFQERRTALAEATK
jgi:hypothetical protein